MLSEASEKKGFVMASVNGLVTWSKTGSLWPMTFGLAGCAVEMIHAGRSLYERTLHDGKAASLA
jgi:NADH:ubiquinone oxidoreductase subunit B-like Fe-S oxidoreductase